MAFTLERVVLWGRSFDEYIRMFDLKDNDLKKNILGCGDGPASFNCEMKKQGHNVISCDPIYQFTKRHIENRINETYDKILEQASQNKDDFIWDTIKSVDELGRIRMSAMNNFLADFDKGKKEGRYLAGELPSLPFQDKEFDLALSSHFLFLYTEQLSLSFHIESIKEMCRVSKEIRIFPLVDLKVEKSRYVDIIISEMKDDKYAVEIRKVPYEFQRGGNEMMWIYEK